MIENQTLRSLQAGRTVVGCFVRYQDATLTELVATQGWDFLIFDCEHGSIETHHLENLNRAAELRGVTPMARVAANVPHLIHRALDAGCQGIHIPSVDSVRDANVGVSAMRYPPLGQRGLAATRAADWGTTEPLYEYTKRADNETLAVVQVETVEAVTAIEELVKVSGIGVIFLGPTDLAQSMDRPGSPLHAEVRDAMLHVAEVVASSDKILGVFASSIESVEEWTSLGARYIATSFEGFVRGGMSDFVKMARRD